MRFIKRVNILGCPFDAISFSGTLQAIRTAILNGERLQIVPGSIDFVMKARRDPVFATELWRADLVVADGVPIVWAASLLGNALEGRVSGTELVWSCAQLSSEMGCSVAMIGATPDVLCLAAVAMQRQFPGALLHPIPTPFPLGRKNNQAVVEQIRAVKAVIVLAALGAPKQERWLQANLDLCGAKVGIGIGSAFDIICGDQPRAPQWMQRMGMEWFQRMLLEPRRLGRRYLIEDLPFLIYLGAEVLRRRSLPSPEGGA